MMPDDESVAIRDYAPGDFAWVAALWQATGVGGAHRGDDASTIARTLAGGGRLLVLEQAGELVGTAWLTDDGRRLYLHHVAVAAERQGRGYGRRLTEAAVNIARQAGRQIKLEVHQDNHRAIQIYRDAGFEALGPYQVWIRRDTGRVG